MNEIAICALSDNREQKKKQNKKASFNRRQEHFIKVVMNMVGISVGSRLCIVVTNHFSAFPEESVSRNWALYFFRECAEQNYFIRDRSESQKRVQ